MYFVWKLYHTTQNWGCFSHKLSSKKKKKLLNKNLMCILVWLIFACKEIKSTTRNYKQQNEGIAHYRSCAINQVCSNHTAVTKNDIKRQSMKWNIVSNEHKWHNCYWHTVFSIFSWTHGGPTTERRRGRQIMIWWGYCKMLTWPLWSPQGFLVGCFKA